MITMCLMGEPVGVGVGVGDGDGDGDGDGEGDGDGDGDADGDISRRCCDVVPARSALGDGTVLCTPQPAIRANPTSDQART